MFAALAVSRLLQEVTGLSIKRLLRTLRPLRSVTIALAGHNITAEPAIPDDVPEILDHLNSVTMT